MRTPGTPDDASILVLTLHTGGHYYGEMLSGVLREAAAAGCNVVVAETRDPGGPHGDRSWGPGFHHPLARRRVGGVVCIANAATPEHLASLRAEGIPVVVASEVHDGFDGPVAMPDNGGAVRAAVQHLVDHGHTRIGFAGSLDIRDFRERHAAYGEALAEHGFGEDAVLHLPTGDYSAEGGARAAEALLAHPDRPTAVVTATDANALGLIARLTEAGVRVPQDVAVVGFDNVEEGAYSTPSLSSVGQRFRDVGALAGRLLLRLMAGEPVAAGSHCPESVVLSRRASCGCRADVGGEDRPGRRAPLPARVHSPVAGLLASLPAAERGRGEAAVRRVEELARAARPPAPGEVTAVVRALRSVTGDGQWLRGAITDVIEHVLHLDEDVPADDPATARHPAGHPVAVALLWELQARAHRGGERRLDASALELERIASALLRQDAEHIRSLAWLESTHVRAGVLALWQGAPDDGALTVVGVHDAQGVTDHRVGQQLDVHDFPGAAITAAGDTAGGEMCVVIPVASRTHEWGLLTLLGQIDTTSVREPYHQVTELLYWALERERLQQQVRTSEERYAWAARASNDGLWELDLATGELYASAQCRALLGVTDGRLSLGGWEDLIHPADLPEVRQATASLSRRATTSSQVEYRVRTPGGGLRWMLSRSLGVVGDDGTVVKVVGALSDVTNRHDLEEHLRRAALYDEVTGLANRRLFLERLGAAIQRAHRAPDAGYAVVFLDLDGFKLVNDSLGHLAGDDLLRAVGERLRTAVRGVDTAARFGGDEFAVLLVDPVDEELLGVAERLQRCVARPVMLGEQEVTVTASIGITTSDSGYTSAEDVLRDADTAMYQSKEHQRGSATLFDSVMHARATDRLRSRSELRRALEERQFVVHYQPIVPLDGSGVTAFEALVRWEHPERGLLAPGAFVPAMEEDGTIVTLGRRVTEEVCRQVARWRAETAHPVRVSVNVSHREFWADDAVESLLDVTSRYGVPPSALALEITESVVVTDTARAQHLLGTLRSHGFGLHVDDFGTGHSSLHALRALPVDTIKIDGSFVRDLGSAARADAIVRAIVTMAEGLEMDVVAEHVETGVQAARLADLGCGSAQGWLYARALPADAAGELLGRRLAAVDA